MPFPLPPPYNPFESLLNISVEEKATVQYQDANYQKKDNWWYMFVPLQRH